ncbi:hypothetical protein ASPZODRAFT_146355 [Penicilliopsis zonata CBS 506.65]|uniref:C2H2-type domain-containing protein n=1 Tax=Penicilliopsis zonata CBS 506.65 TaxID=1073090 RepID=A0A1L9S796_9EURO|nr:hypothetical protein ASPZODRAFT_146355 [Penicilliopsis zonata CBS 506.65]OJJ43045.1 hypothetical protein ASPZODRAFT_146355 [Penicilliopsis zonata CBS 506.65]
MACLGSYRVGFDGKKWFCIIDGETFDTKTDVMKHYAEKHGCNVVCTRCTLVFASIEAWQAHMADPECHNPCLLCPFPWPDFASTKKLAQHLFARHKMCTICEAHGFIEEADILKHKEDDHNWCLECGFICADQNELLRHADTHDDVNLPCWAGCGKLFGLVYSPLAHYEKGECPLITIEQYREAVGKAADDWMGDISLWYAGMQDAPYRCIGCDGCASEVSELFDHVMHTKECLEHPDQGLGVVLDDIRAEIRRMVGRVPEEWEWEDSIPMSEAREVISQTVQDDVSSLVRRLTISPLGARTFLPQPIPSPNLYDCEETEYDTTEEDTEEDAEGDEEDAKEGTEGTAEESEDADEGAEMKNEEEDDEMDFDEEGNEEEGMDDEEEEVEIIV